ncbi:MULTISPECIES: hypothetical protein [unclassified Nocardioides]|uniref:hypothetical protein n=1 Tax=Nocardioides sp. URHA0032 TaxID=1380388 RepID=UPI0006881779|nr:hypothetical protein [Nocardioides sp. URHA0032]
MAEDAPRRDPLGLVAGGEGTITGTVVCAAAIAYTAGHSDTIWQVSAAILGTVFVYWLAHLHAVTVGSSLTRGHHPLAALRHGLHETWPILGASVVPLVVLLGSRLFGAEIKTAGWIALLVSIALLTRYSWVAGRRGGLDTWGCVASAAAGFGLGLVVVLLKVALH